jgi:hypothetical protein
MMIEFEAALNLIGKTQAVRSDHCPNQFRPSIVHNAGDSRESDGAFLGTFSSSDQSGPEHLFVNVMNN